MYFSLQVKPPHGIKRPAVAHPLELFPVVSHPLELFPSVAHHFELFPAVAHLLELFPAVGHPLDWTPPDVAHLLYFNSPECGLPLNIWQPGVTHSSE